MSFDRPDPGQSPEYCDPLAADEPAQVCDNCGEPFTALPYLMKDDRVLCGPCYQQVALILRKGEVV